MILGRWWICQQRAQLLGSGLPLTRWLFRTRFTMPGSCKALPTVPRSKRLKTQKMTPPLPKWTKSSSPHFPFHHPSPVSRAPPPHSPKSPPQQFPRPVTRNSSTPLTPMLKPLSGPDEKRPRKHSPPSSAATPKSVENNISWNELSPYLERFEQLEHLPLFFCHANADAILRKEDTMAGYRRSGSKWKEVIEYVEEVAKKPVRAATLPVSLSIEPVKSKVDDGTSHLSVLDDAGSDGSQSSTASPDPIRSRKPGKRRLAASIKLTPLKDDSGIDLDKPVLASPVATTPVTVEPPVMEPPKRKEGLKSRYSVPETFKYGHCDILGGRHAEQVWERIVDWLDATTAREREWRFKRRYSAK
ncbi:hypothetical protein BC829DRAFT_194739 [Chytridium lagenaria]|nr:hypothetical protein BC829DRAFT_194739 [Chytridium lagenaria]